jgi:hypothetical protein
MKHLIIVGLMALSSMLIGQEKEVAVAFSKANELKTLDIQIFSGDIKIIGGDRKDALIRYTIEKNEDDDEKEDEKSNGMKKIGGGNFQFEIGEKNNTVMVKSQNFMNLLVMEIEVPSGINIDLSKQIGQNIYIENIQGAINVENNVGSITMKKISGSVNASSSTGEIVVDFVKIDPNQAMTFNTITGNIDLTFNSGHKADLKMRTEWGEIYSDMNIETKEVEDADMKKVSKDGSMKVISNNWTFGVLNGGGPEMTLKTQMGSIYLRASK